MRFLFVYQDYKEQAQQLIDELGIRDVTLIVARKNANGPTADDLALLQLHRGAAAAACEINRKYRKSASLFVQFSYEPKKFRIGDQQLREWLAPKPLDSITIQRPSLAFRRVARDRPDMVLCPDALELADDVAEHRWAFVHHGACLLGQYAAGDILVPLRDWKARYGIDFAANSRVRFRYRIWSGDTCYQDKSEWHLKQGDKTTRESAARIYFARVELSSGPKVVIFYVGPHPPDGEYAIEISVKD